MWSRRVLLATLVAAAAVTMARHVPATAPGFVQAHGPSFATVSFR